MAQMNISIPEALKAWAERRVAEGRYASTSDYIRDLVRKDQDAVEEAAWLQKEIEKGFAAPIDPRPPEQIFADVRARYRGQNG